MGIFDRFPYSSTHEMNLDFMLGKATEIAESLQEIDTHKNQAEQAATNAAQSAQSAAQAAQAAAGSQTAAGTSASQAAQHKADAEDAADRAEAASNLADEAVEQAQTAAQNASTAAQNASTAADGAIASATAAETRINNLADSLPEDFTELNNEVTDLKSAITQLNFVTPEMFGAVGDGTTDDTLAIQKMFDETTSEILCFNKRYLVTQTIISSKPRNIISNTNNNYIHGSLSDPVLKFEYQSGDENDYRNFYIKNINVYQNGNGHAVAIVGYGDRIIDMNIDNCKFYAAYPSTTGYGLYIENSLAHSLISNCGFRGNGVYANVRDANLFFKCTVFGKGNGIVIKPAQYGCLNNAIKDCTIVNTVGNAIQVIDGEQIIIENNQIEYATNDEQTANIKALICLVADQRHCEHIIIKDNNFGGGSSVTNQLNISGAYDTFIANNRFVALTGKNIVVDQYSKRTRIEPNNYRTDLSGNITLVTIDANSEILNFIIPITFDHCTLNVLKKDDGFVEFKFVNVTSLADSTNIGTLPSGYYNTGYIQRLFASDPEMSMKTIQISNTGMITLVGATLAGFYYPIGRYYVGL